MAGPERVHDHTPLKKVGFRGPKEDAPAGWRLFKAKAKAD